MKAKLLVPFDGSSGSLRALQHAIQMAKNTDVELVILNVQFNYNTRNVRKFTADHQIRAFQDEAARRSFEKAEELLEGSGVTYTLRKRIGLPDQAILEESRNEGIQAIVMGTRGVGRVKGALLGSVSQNVLQSTTIPVTIVP
ncbi:universal stress protein [Halobacillus sp. Marseille-Q1614]|uniref:universal stress protein n=1 Tax=Halobacillus sp. Marseille-Q1614 TaxID=2709134 RepID=UPI00156FB5DC|nr:universal stress protein [Halobacillus sp. Marseille-Q1614]